MDVAAGVGRRQTGVLVLLLVLVRLLDVDVELVGAEEEGAAQRGAVERAEAAAVVLGANGLVHLEEVLAQKVEVVEELHLFAQDAAEHFDAVLLLYVADEVADLEQGEAALAARVVGFFGRVGVERVRAVVLVKEVAAR